MPRPNFLASMYAASIESINLYDRVRYRGENTGDPSTKDPYVKKRATLLPDLSKGDSYKANLSFSNNRGIIAYKSDFNKQMAFQFNPTELEDSYTPAYQDRSRTGQDRVDYFWTNGSPRTIKFRLFLDATGGSLQGHIGKGTTDNFTHNPERGVLNQTEFLTALLRPELPKNGVFNDVVFNRGNVRSHNKFYAPPEVIFVYGYFYLQGVITQASPTYTLFDSKLIPIRAEIDVELRVTEGITVNIDSSLTNLVALNLR